MPMPTANQAALLVLAILVGAGLYIWFEISAAKREEKRQNEQTKLWLARLDEKFLREAGVSVERDK